MATVTHLVTTPDAGNTPNTSGAFSPASGDLLVVIVTKEASALSSPMVSADLTSSVAPTGFTLIRTQGHQSSAAHVGIFVANALTTNTTSRTVTIASGADAGAGTNISVFSVSGMTKVGSAAVRGQGGQTDQAAATPAPAFGAAALTTNPCIGAIYNATNPAGLTQPSGWSEGSDTGYTTGQVSGIETAFRNSGETGTTITWGSASASAFASIILELDASADPIFESNADTLSFTENFTKRVNDLVADTVAFTETFVKRTNKAVADTVSLVENLDAVKVVVRGISDSVSLSEGFAKRVNDVIGETVALTESRVFGINRLLAETVGFTENFVVSRVKTLGDTLGVTELLTQFIQRRQTETVGLSEALVKETIPSGGGPVATPMLNMSLSIGLRIG